VLAMTGSMFPSSMVSHYFESVYLDENTEFVNVVQVAILLTMHDVSPAI
jgi:hypothetical protein